MKFLIVKRDKLGDLILTSYLIKEISRRHPACIIDLWVTDFTRIVHQENPAVRNCYSMEKIRLFDRRIAAKLWSYLRTLYRIRKTQYDLVVVAGGEYSPKAIRKIRLLLFKHSVAYCPQVESSRYPYLTNPIPLMPKDTHEGQRILGLFLRYEGSSELSAHESFRLQDRPEVGWAQFVRSAGAHFQALHALDPGRYFVIGLGARKANRQPDAQQVERWAAWIEKTYGLPVVLAYTPSNSIDPGYPSDEALAREIKARCPSIILMGGSIFEAIGVILEAYFAVIPDSGLMHAATTGKARVMGLFADCQNAPSHIQWGPIGDYCDVVIANESISEMADEEIFSKIAALT